MKLFLALALVGFLALPVRAEGLGERIANAAAERTTHDVRYDGAYLTIGYPMGDVPDDIGVCTDVVIRSLRAEGIDLQKEIHEDMKAHFNAYPKRWGLTKVDSNIDHRRVPNIQTWATRKGFSLPITEVAEDYLPGDLVTWNVAASMAHELPHIGIVSNRANAQGRPLIIHNIGQGPLFDDMIFQFKVTGHYRLKDAP